MGSATRERRRRRDEWQALVDEQQASGLTQSAFCRQRGLALSTFHYWKRKLATAEAGDSARVSAASSGQPAFTEIALPDADEGETRPSEVELELGPGVRVIIRWGESC